MLIDLFIDTKFLEFQNSWFLVELELFFFILRWRQISELFLNSYFDKLEKHSLKFMKIIQNIKLLFFNTVRKLIAKFGQF